MSVITDRPASRPLLRPRHGHRHPGHHRGLGLRLSGHPGRVGRLRAAGTGGGALRHRGGSGGAVPADHPAGPAALVGGVAVLRRRAVLRRALHHAAQSRRTDGVVGAGELHHQRQSDHHRGARHDVPGRAVRPRRVARHGGVVRRHRADRARRRRRSPDRCGRAADSRLRVLQFHHDGGAEAAVRAAQAAHGLGLEHGDRRAAAGAVPAERAGAGAGGFDRRAGRRDLSRHRAQPDRLCELEHRAVAPAGEPRLQLHVLRAAGGDADGLCVAGRGALGC